MSVNSSNITTTEYIQHHLQHLPLNLHNFTFTNNGFWTLNLDTMFISILLGIIFLFFFRRVAKHSTPGVPDKFHNLIEMVIEFIDKFVKEMFHGRSRLIAPLSLTIFIWILLMNAMDFLPVDLLSRLATLVGLPYFRPVPTADPNATFGMSIAVFFLVIFYSFKVKGLHGFAKEILFTPFKSSNSIAKMVLMPFNIGLNFIEHLARPVSLSMRLFGNLFAGELIFVLIAAFIPWWIQWPLGSIWGLFHILIVLIQAFVFMVLTIIYLGLAHEAHD